LTAYADTSFFVSVYIADRHSSPADQFLASCPKVFFTSLHFAEWAHAVSQHVFRGQSTPSEADAVHRKLEQDRAAGLWVEVALPEHAFELCAELAKRHGSRLGTRTLDSLHVACALELKATRFWTFDDRQAKLARAVGLKLT
jgi:predicted nucleic acid-binding protein